jgi:hypothetical protein
VHPVAVPTDVNAESTHPGHPQKSTGTPTSSLLAGLEAVWKLDEQSGTRNDSVGSNHLTDNNTVAAVNRGPLGTVASFVAAGSESLSHATFGEFSAAQSKTFSIWFKDTNASALQAHLVSRDEAGAREYAIYTGNTVISFLVFDSGGNPTTLDSNADFGETFPKNVWHHIVCWFDSSDNTLHYRVDGGTARSKAGTGDIRFGTGATFRLGTTNVAGVATEGQLARVGVWNSVLEADQITTLFNSGNGLDYAGVIAAGLPTPVEFWNLDEVSGNRIGEVSATVLTDNNTVLSVNSGPQARVADFESGSAEYLNNATLAAGLDASLGITMAQWVRAESVGGTEPLASIGLTQPFGGTGVMTPVEIGGVWVMVGSDDTAQVANFSAVAVETGKWYLVTSTYDPSDKKFRLYVDGALTCTTNAVTNHPSFAAGLSRAVFIGANQSAGGAYSNLFDGQQGYVGIWNTLPADIAAFNTTLFNSGNGLDYAGVIAAGLPTPVEFWNLTEASGNRTGSVSATVLTDNNTVGSVINAGGAMDGAAASFVAANNESLTNASPTGIPTDDQDITISAWVRIPTGTAANVAIAGNYDISAGGFGNLLYFDNTNARFRFFCGLLSTVIQTPVSSVSYDTWYHVVGWHDTGANTINIVVNNGTVYSAADASQPGTAAKFGIGAYFNGGAIDTTEDGNGRIDEVAIYDRVLTADEIACLFSLGAGGFYDYDNLCLN